MHAQSSSRTVLFDVGGVLVESHPDPAVIARMFGDESRGLFDFFAFSCDYGICKPSRGIYRDVLHRLNTPVEDVAFIDDRRENVRAAELLGVQGIVWEGADQAEARLKELGFLF